MGLSSSKTKTQSTSTSSPLDQYAPYITQGLTTAQGIMNSNQGNMQALGSKALDVANGFGAQQGTLANIYGGNSQAGQTYGRLQNAGANDPSLGALSGLAQGSTSPGNYDGIGANNPSLAILQGMTNGQVNGDTSGYYKDVIGGKYLDNNPYVDAMAQQATDAATKAQNSRFAASGMGEGMSTPYSQALGKSVADANNGLRYQNYNAERQLQQQASGMSDSEYNATQDRNLSAATGLGSLYNQTGALNLSAQQAKDAAFNNDRNSHLAAATALGNQNNADNATSLGAANGSMSSILQALGLSGTLSQDQLAALQTAAGIPYTGVNAYSNIVNGLTGKYGTNSTNSTQTQSGNIGQMLSGLAGSALGAFAGGGLGGLAGMAGSAGARNVGMDALGGLSLPGLNTTPNLSGLRF